MSEPGPSPGSLHLSELSRLDVGDSERLVVIGNFDGVHRGHQKVLKAAAQKAIARGLQLCALTFDPHPSVFFGRKQRSVLTAVDTKVALLRQVVEDLQVAVITFDEQLASLNPREFASKVLREMLNARAVLVGENFRFGRARRGDLQDLIELGAELGFDAWAEELYGDGDGAYSSTRIRSLLEEGRVEKAARLLGRSHQICGVVVAGDRRGVTLGFPTANLAEVTEAVACDGVYAVEVFVREEMEKNLQYLARGVAHLGERPTLGRPHTLEVHLIDFSADLYGRRLFVSFLERIRGVEKFESVDQLKNQIADDVICARKIANFQDANDE